MKNYKVRATRNFTDKVEQKERVKNNEFDCTKERYEFLKDNRAVELVEIIEEKKEEVVDELQVDPYENFEIKEAKPKTKRTTKKTSKK